MDSCSREYPYPIRSSATCVGQGTVPCPSVPVSQWSLLFSSWDGEPSPVPPRSSLHGAPPLAIHSIPFSAVRLSHFAGRPRFPSFGCSGGSISLIRFHSLSVSSYLFVPMCLVYIILSVCASFIFQTRPSFGRSSKSEVSTIRKLFSILLELRRHSNTPCFE